MDDLISRAAAIDALDRAAECWNIAEPFNEGIRAGYKAAVTIVLSLPSAQPYTDEEIQKMQDLEQAQFDKIRELERIRGEWIYDPTESLGYKCSVCGKGCCTFNYCPNCGAEMRRDVSE